MATSVSCCTILDSLMAGGPGEDEAPVALDGIKLAMPAVICLKISTPCCP